VQTKFVRTSWTRIAGFPAITGKPVVCPACPQTVRTQSGHVEDIGCDHLAAFEAEANLQNAGLDVGTDFVLTDHRHKIVETVVGGSDPF
jgi:hypothetical protein